MKSLYLLLIIFFAAVSANAQKCKTEKDPFSNEEVTNYYFNNRILFSYNHSNQQVLLNFKLTYTDEYNEYMKEGEQIVLKLENGDILEFTSNTRIDPVSQAYQIGVFTSYTFNFTLSKEELKKLASSEVLYMQKPDMHGGVVNVNVKKHGNNRYWKHFTKGAECIAENF